nr:surface-adhesin E family protein [Brevundimonas diminuta]
MITDVDGIRRTGDIAGFNTVMFSRRIEHFNGRASWATRTANEINCRTNQRREVRSSYLSEGGGVISSDAGSGAWQTISQGSTGWAIRDLACDRTLTPNNIEFGSSFNQAEQMARRVLGH